MKNKKRYIHFLLVFAFLITSAFYLFYKNPSFYILQQIRLPRFMLTFFAGFILAGIGAVYQILLNNPLAEPYILGISSGAALGSVVAIVSGMVLLAPIFGFAGAIITTIVVWKLAFWGGYFNNTKLILSGIIVGMFLSALISLLMYLFQKDIGNILQVLMGNLGRIFTHNEWIVFLIVFASSIILVGYLYFLTNKIDVLSSGEISAISLGVDVKKLRKQIFFISSILTGAVVAYTGVIGFIGLVVPHLMRMIIGLNLRKNFLYVCLSGAILLLVCDFIAANIAVIEIPVGIVTSFVGSPFFLFIMIKKNK